MAALQGTILASKIVPTDSLDTYATHDDKYGRGGHRSVDTLEERDNITTPRRKEGMTVYVKENKTKYILESGIENANWKVDSSGGGSGGDVDLSDYYKKTETYSKVEVDTKIADIPPTDLSGYYTKTQTETLLSNKVDKVTGKGLSTNDFTDTFKQAYDGHLASTSNPHNVTALQVGAYSKSENDNLLIKKANLDINNKIHLSEIPDSILGQLKYMGVWDFSSGFPTGAQKGNYWITSVSGNGYEVGDWTVYNGTSFDKVDNTDAVSSVAGRTGNVVLNKNDVGLNNVDNTSDLNKPISTATQTALNTTVKLIGNETIAGIKTFSSNIVGNITGNAATATKLETARTINGVAFDGSANITVDTSDTTAVKLTGNQTIAGVKTFTSSPIVPTPTTDFQVVTKKYVDDRAQLGTNAYQGAYGISWDSATDTYIRTGAKGYTAIQSLMRRCVVNADGTVNYYLNPDNSNFKEDGTPSVLTGDDGNVMVEIPKHYIKAETVDTVDSFSISLTPEVDYILDPAFLKWNGTEMVEVPYRYFRAYEGFVSDGKLLSVSGVTPTRSQNIATFRTQAMANGAGWHLTDWNLLNTIKRLCYIEFGDFIVTRYLGEGNHIGTDYGITTGQSNALGNRSSKGTHNDKYMSYRGIENLYADIWEFVDGININNYQAYVNQKWSTFASNVFTGDYVAKGPLIAAGAGNSFIKRCDVSADGGFIPTVVGGSTTTFYGDALWSATGYKVAIYGGSASDGASGGLGALVAASSGSNAALGASVCR